MRDRWYGLIQTGAALALKDEVPQECPRGCARLLRAAGSLLFGAIEHETPHPFGVPLGDIRPERLHQRRSAAKVLHHGLLRYTAMLAIPIAERDHGFRQRLRYHGGGLTDSDPDEVFIEVFGCAPRMVIDLARPEQSTSASRDVTEKLLQRF